MIRVPPPQPSDVRSFTLSTRGIWAVQREVDRRLSGYEQTYQAHQTRSLPMHGSTTTYHVSVGFHRVETAQLFGLRMRWNAARGSRPFPYPSDEVHVAVHIGRGKTEYGHQQLCRMLEDAQSGRMGGYTVPDYMTNTTIWGYYDHQRRPLALDVLWPVSAPAKG